MPLRTLLLLLFIALVAGFAALNWTAFTTPVPLSLGVTTVEAPLGLAMLALVVVVALAFLGYVALFQGRLLLETRRHAKELQAQRLLADQAEASRFTELRALLQAEVVRLEGALRGEIRDSANSLAAMIGELDDRVTGVPGSAPVRHPAGFDGRPPIPGA
jgi:uncharacterized integral membrane protein